MNIPRVLLKNGKRSKVQFELSQMKSESCQTTTKADSASPSQTSPKSCGSPDTCIVSAADIDMDGCSGRSSVSGYDLTTAKDYNTGCNLSHQLPSTSQCTDRNVVTCEILHGSGCEVNRVSSNSSDCFLSQSSVQSVNHANGYGCVPLQETSGNDRFFRASVISDINCLKVDVSNIRHDINQLRIDSQKPSTRSKSCFLYVRLNITDMSSIGTSLLESVLSCSIHSYWIHKAPVVKVKISQANLLAALMSGNQNGHHVSVWQNKRTSLGAPDGNTFTVQPNHRPSTRHTIVSSISVLSWNSRGLTSSVPYVTGYGKRAHFAQELIFQNKQLKNVTPLDFVHNSDSLKCYNFCQVD